jgi:hypothetical protein
VFVATNSALNVQYEWTVPKSYRYECHPFSVLEVNIVLASVPNTNTYFILSEETAKFHKWLDTVSEAFKSLSPEQQFTTFHTLLQQCSPNQRYNISKHISGILYQDILISLPAELMEQIGHYIDTKSLLSACCVSKQWNGFV